MTVQILLVCTANVCRSPTAQLLLLRRIGGLESADVRVSSAGTLASPGQPWCEVAARWQGAGRDARDFQKRHRARRLSADLIESADLVMTGDRTHRGTAVLLVPTARRRVFTLREAAALAQEATRDLRQGPGVRADESQGSGLGATVEDRIRWLVEEMDAKRGLVHLDDREPSRRWPSRLSSARPASDIPDPHSEGGGRHGRGLSLLSAAVDSWTSSLGRVVPLPERE